jgi:hypothetical protein
MKISARWFALLILYLSPINAVAQNAISSGSISGQATDATGAAITGATVIAENVASGVKLTTKTNGAGFYTFSSLNVGRYKVSVSQTGFKKKIMCWCRSAKTQLAI